MVGHICPMSPTPQVVDAEVIYDPLPNMGIGQGAVEVEEGSFGSKGSHSL